MLSLTALGVGLGWDSLEAGFGLGTLRIDRKRWLLLPIAFGLADGGAALAGMGLGHALSPRLQHPSAVIAALLIASAAVAMVFGTRRSRATILTGWAGVRVPISAQSRQPVRGHRRRLDRSRSATRRARDRRAQRADGAERSRRW